MPTVFACGLGIASTNQQGEILEVFYPQPLHNVQPEDAESIFEALEETGISASTEKNAVYALSNLQAQQLHASLRNKGMLATMWPAEISGNNKQVLFTLLITDSELNAVPEAYLKLQLLSHRLVKPQSISLDGILAACRM